MVSGLILLVVFLLMFAGHWMPWRVVPALVNARGDLKRVPSYIYGIVGLLVGFVMWALAMDSEMLAVQAAVTFLVMDAIAAGLGTVTPRLIRWILEEQAAHEDAEELKHGTAKHKR